MSTGLSNGGWFLHTEYGPCGGAVGAGITTFGESHPSILFSTSCRSPPRRRRSAQVLGPWCHCIRGKVPTSTTHVHVSFFPGYPGTFSKKNPRFLLLLMTCCYSFLHLFAWTAWAMGNLVPPRPSPPHPNPQYILPIDSLLPAENKMEKRTAMQEKRTCFSGIDVHMQLSIQASHRAEG